MRNVVLLARVPEVHPMMRGLTTLTPEESDDGGSNGGFTGVLGRFLSFILPASHLFYPLFLLFLLQKRSLKPGKPPKSVKQWYTRL